MSKQAYKNNLMSNKIRIAGYAATVFVSSALLLVLEIVAGRIIAPYVGVSLYSWTSIIGVMLGGLSLGNWLGGIWADRGAGTKATGLVLLASGLSCFTILLFLTFIAPAIQSSNLGILSASFIFALLLFFIPAMLLGIITPLLTVLALQLDNRSGHIIGMMNALAALGSILGTFLTGYWLIQVFGTYTIIIVCASILMILAFPYVINVSRKQMTLSLFGMTLIISLSVVRNSYQNPCLVESQYYCIRVKDQSQLVPFGTTRTLILDNLSHGTNHKQVPKMLIERWVHLMDEIIFNYFGEKSNSISYFFAGGGSYTHPRAIKARSEHATIVVAEIDPMITKTVRENLFLDTSGIKIQHLDARVALRKHQPRQFDVVVGDVFHDITVPYHLTTREYNQLIKSRLKHNGLYLLNIVDTYPNPLLIKSIYKTLKMDFKNVHIWLETLPDSSQRTTYVLSASDVYQAPEALKAKRGFKLRSWKNLTKTIIETGTELNKLPVLTDRFAPVEKLVSRLLY